METVTILRELWRRRIFVGLAAVVAILVGLLLAFTVSLPPESRRHDVGTAASRILVDTPDSQVIDVSPRGSGSLGVRANLLANLMTEGAVKAAIARRAGLSPKQLVAGVEAEGEVPEVLQKAEGNAEAHVLTTRLAVNPDGAPLPIIEIKAQAPGVEGAARLASAADSGLRDYLDSKAAAESVDDARRLEVTGFGAPLSRREMRGPTPLIALGAAVFVFLCGCAAIIVVSALARGWRAASEEDEPRDRDPGDRARARQTAHDPLHRRLRARSAKLAASVQGFGANLIVHLRRALASTSANDGGSSARGTAPAVSSAKPSNGGLWVPGSAQSLAGKPANGHNGERPSLELPLSLARNGSHQTEVGTSSTKRNGPLLARPPFGSSNGHLGDASDEALAKRRGEREPRRKSPRRSGVD